MDSRHSVIIVLGYKNRANGELHPIAKQRADKALEVAGSKDCQLICTGGFGDNFNQSDTAHGLLVKQYLASKGIAEQRFLSHAPSRNTYEDGRFCADILALLSINEILLVTSDFHIQRGFLWLHHFCPELEIVCCPAKTKVNNAEMKNLLAHEALAMTKFYADFPTTPLLDDLYDFDALNLPC